MADFCGQCTRDALGEDPALNDFVGLCKEGAVSKVLCEGCGRTQVNHFGFCASPMCEVHPYDTEPVRGLRDENLPEHTDREGMRGE